MSAWPWVGRFTIRGRKLQQVDYEDDCGRRFRVLVPDGCSEDMYAKGIPIGPPSLEGLGLPLDLEVRLHNQLHDRRLFSLRDALRRPKEIQAALQAALRLDMQRIQTLYHSEAQGG